MFKHYIDEVLLKDEPDGWENFVINIARDRDAQALIVKYPITLIFGGDGWQTLKAIFDLPTGYCEDVDYRVEKSCTGGFKTLFRAKIFISQVQFNLSKCQAEVQVEDNSFFARVFNNKKLPAKIDVDKSKNDVTITIPTPIALTMFTPSTGLDAAFTRNVFDVKDVFTFLTQWMSDGELGFRSDFYDNLDDDKSASMALGKEIRLATGSTDNVPTISFEDLFESQRKLYNLLMTIETDLDGSVFLRIEDDEFFFGSNTVFDLTAIDNMVEAVIEDDLFSSVKFKSIGSGTIGTFPQITFLSWNEEEFVVSGQCNSDNALDLEVDVVTNSNVIGSMMSGASTFDEDIIFIQYIKSTSTATRTNPQALSPAATIYNEEYLNSVVSTRYDLQGNITKFLGDGDDGFRASNTVSSVIAVTPPVSDFVFPIPFDDDFTPPNEDPNGNYDPVLFRYTSPLQGLYTFSFDILYRWNVLNAQIGEVTIAIERYDSADVLLETFTTLQQQVTANPAPNTPYQIVPVVTAINLDATDYVTTRATGFTLFPTGDSELEILADSSFLTTATANGGGLFEEKDIDDYRVIGVQFDRALNAEQIESLTSQTFRPILVDHDGVTKKTVYIDNVNINAYNGVTNWQMIRNINNA